jgi:hypothetical protein
MPVNPLSPSNTNISGAYDVNQWNYVRNTPNGPFAQQVAQGRVSAHLVRATNRRQSFDAQGAVTYTKEPDKELQSQVTVARQNNLPVNFYDRAIPKNIAGANASDTSVAEAQGRQQAQQFLQYVKPYLKPGDSVTGDFEEVPTANPASKTINEWKNASPLQRIAYVKAYMDELDKQTGTKATFYTAPGFMSDYLPYPLKAGANVTQADADRYNKMYQELAQNRPLWLVDSYTQTQRADSNGANRNNRLSYPDLFQVPPVIRQVGLADVRNGNFPLGGKNTDMSTSNPNLDQNVMNETLKERVNRSYQAQSVSFAPGHKNAWEVTQIQNSLKAAGIWNGSINGVYDENLKKAVEAFQRKNNLPVTGTVDYNTLQALPMQAITRTPANGQDGSRSNGLDPAKQNQQIKR